MTQHVVKVNKATVSFQIVIPRKVILEKRWGDVTHVLIDDQWGDKLLIRRLIDGKALKGDD